MAEKEKKRKRPSEGGQKPKKRRSIDQHAADIQVTVEDGGGKLCPVVGECFLHDAEEERSSRLAAITPGIQLKPISFDSYTSKPDDHAADHLPNPTTHSVVLRSSDHALLDFTAYPECQGEVTHYLGVYDAQKKSIQLVAAHAVALKGTLRSEAAEVFAQNEEVARTKTKQREQLGLEFGTKKAKKAINSKTINAITGESAKGVEDAIMVDVRDAAAATPAESQRQDEILKSKPIPRPNFDAKQPQDVYPLTTLVHAGDLRSLTVKDWQDSVQAGVAVQLSSRFVANRLEKVVAKDNVQMLKALKYLLLLIEFVGVLKVAGKSGRKVPPNDQLKSRLAGWSETLVDNVRRKFAQGGYVVGGASVDTWSRVLIAMQRLEQMARGQFDDTHCCHQPLHRWISKRYARSPRRSAHGEQAVGRPQSGSFPSSRAN